MYKFIALIPRRQDVSREFFQNYYETQHAPLALGYFRGFHKYVRNHIVQELSGSAPDFDVFSEFWYESIEELSKSGAFLESEYGPIIREDERQFMDQPRIRALHAEEHLLFGGERCLEPEASKLALAIRLSDGEQSDEILSFLKSYGKELGEQWGASRISCFMVEQGDQANQWDVILFAWVGDQADRSFTVPAEPLLWAEDHLLVKTRALETHLSDVYQNVPAKKGATSELSI